MVDIPGNTTSTTTIRVGDTVTGSLETLSDQDWYRITLTAGQEIRISLNGFGTTPARDPYLEIRSSTGTVLSFNDDTGGGLNSMLTYRATTSGTYFINATSYAGSSTGTYQLSVASNQVPTSDIPDNATTSAVLSVGAAASGTLEFVGDRDWYRLNLTAGQQIKIDLTAAGASPLDDTYLRVYDANGNLLYENDDLSATSLNSSLAFQAPTSGAFYVSVGSFDDAEVGTYQVTVNPYQFPAEYSFQQMANQLVTGYWGGLSHRFNVGPGGTLTVNVSALTPSGQYLARAALAEWSEIMGVTFMEVFSGGQIVFDDDEDGAHADSVYSGGVITSSTVNVSTDWLTTNGTTLNSYSFQTYVHEIGHALGLGHAGNYNGDATFPYDALYANDSWASSVMSYFSQTENTLIANRGFSYNLISTPMIADILAISMLYGLSTTTRAGNTTYGPGEWSSSMGALTIFDSGGTDTIDLSGFGGNHRVDLNPGTFSNVLGEVGNVAIALGTTIENAVGGTGNDTLIGNNAANTLTGGGGADILTGAGGNDFFAGTRAGLNGDRITDFGFGDRIWVQDASLATFTFSADGTTLNYSGGSLTFGSTLPGGITASAAAQGGVLLSLVVNPSFRAADFNGDGQGDILWRHDNGTVTNWLGQSDGGFVGNYAAGVLALENAWQVAGTGDFNGDGRDDVLWRHQNGTVTNWLASANGSFVGNYANAAYSVNANWQMAGVGDFNGDRRDDVLWRDESGNLTGWLGQANGSFVLNAAGSLPLENSWQAIGTGDFNGDGRDDVLWRHENGTLTNWLGQANGGFVGNYAAGVLALESAWQVVGVGDFDGDGRDDVLWRNSNGVLTDWLAQPNGSFAGNYATWAVQVTPEWDVAAVGDVNGDGRDDIIWRNDSGLVTDWLGQPNGGFNSTPAASLLVETSWHIEPGDIFGI